MATIKWVETVPSNTSLVGYAPQDFKSVWTAISVGMATEHYFPGSGGGSDASAGDLLPGGSRCFVAAKSLSSAPNSQYTGRFFLDTDNSRLYAYESAATYMVGSSWYDDHSLGTGGTAGTSYWLRQSGAVVGVSTGSGTTRVTFPTPYVAGPSQVFLSVSNTSWFATPAGLGSDATGFISFFSSFAGAASTVTLYWEATGLASTGSI